MRRREFIKLLCGSAVAGAPGARALAAHTPLVCVVMAFDEKDPDGQRYAAAFRETLGQLGWTPGTNIRIDFLWNAFDAEHARVIAAQAVKLKPDIIVSHATVATRAVAQQTRTIPVVFTNVSDPVAEHFVLGFSRPGGNITGFTNVEPSMGSKYVELLKQIAPEVTRVGMIYNPKSTPGGGAYFYTPFEAAASILHVQPVKGEVQDIADVDNFLTKLARDKGSGVIVIGEPFTNLHRMKIIESAAQRRLPAICPYRIYAKSGCLISYGIDFADQFRRAATYVDRILKGDQPATLPVQSPTKFEMVVNLNTAKALNLKVPDKLLVSADEVIE